MGILLVIGLFIGLASVATAAPQARLANGTPSVTLSATAPAGTTTVTPTPAAPVSVTTPVPAPAPQGFGRIVISEVMAAPVNAGNREAQFQWVEIRNLSPTVQFLDGWTIENAFARDSLPFITIQPHGLAVVAASGLAVGNVPSGVQVALLSDASIGGGLSPQRDRLVLKDGVGATIDALSWGGDMTYNLPSCPGPATGRSLERTAPGIIGPCMFEENAAPSPGVARPEPTPTPVAAPPTATPVITATPAGGPAAAVTPVVTATPQVAASPTKTPEPQAGSGAPLLPVFTPSVPAFTLSIPSFSPAGTSGSTSAGSAPSSSGPAPSGSSSGSSGSTSPPSSSSGSSARPPSTGGSDSSQVAAPPAPAQSGRQTPSQAPQQQPQAPQQSSQAARPAAAAPAAASGARAPAAPAGQAAQPAAAAKPASEAKAVKQVDSWDLGTVLLPVLALIGLGAMYLGIRTFREVQTYEESEPT